MMRGGWMSVMVGLMIATGAAAAPPPRLPKLDRITLRIRHRVFADFVEVDTVRIKQDFRIGDTQYSARVVEYVPDFFMDVKRHTIASRSSEPKNPGFRIIVREKGVPRDTTWAFLNPMVHFTRKSLLSFQVLRIDFPDRPPILADSTHAPPGAGGVAPKAGRP